MRRGAHNAEFCELCTLFSTAETPGRGCHGEQTAFFGREAQSNFSLLPVNLRLGRKTQHPMDPWDQCPLPLPWDSFFLEINSLLETQPFLLWMRTGGGEDIRKGALHWSKKKSNTAGGEDPWKMTLTNALLLFEITLRLIFFFPLISPPTQLLHFSNGAVTENSLNQGNSNAVKKEQPPEALLSLCIPSLQLHLPPLHTVLVREDPGRLLSTLGADLGSSKTLKCF